MSARSKEQEVYDLYGEDLQRLTFNSKPVIGNLTELAFEYRKDFAHVIVRIIEERIRKVRNEEKLPCLYLLDSIVKNHNDPYLVLFQQNIVSTFSHVFQTANEKTRLALHKLRLTWNGIFNYPKLNQLDIKVHGMDPAWPIMKPAAESSTAAASTPSSGSIHINPAMFAKRQASAQPSSSEAERFAEELRRKELELMELKKKKLELDMIATKKQIEERQAQINGQAATAPTSKSPSQVRFLSSELRGSLLPLLGVISSPYLNWI